MWILLGFIALIATCINLYLYRVGREYELAMAMALSFTALTLVAQYSMVFNWVKQEDWSALLDVVPTMEKALWVLTSISIIVNIAPVLLELKTKKR